MEKGVEAEIASFENELSVDIDWNSTEILHPSNHVDHWRLILWDKAFRVYFEDKGDLIFSKGLELLEFDEGPIAIKRVAYRYALLSFFHLFRFLSTAISLVHVFHFSGTFTASSL